MVRRIISRIQRDGSTGGYVGGITNVGVKLDSFHDMLELAVISDLWFSRRT